MMEPMAGVADRFMSHIDRMSEETGGKPLSLKYPIQGWLKNNSRVTKRNGNIYSFKKIVLSRFGLGHNIHLRVRNPD